MKYELKLWRRTNYILFGIFILMIVVGVSILTSKWIYWHKKEDEFRSKEIRSKIILLRNLQRGSYLLQVQVQDSVKEYSLPMAYEVKKDGIKVGDSLFKNKGSDTFLHLS